MKSNVIFILSAMLLLACSAAQTEEDAELQNTLDAAVIGMEEIGANNVNNVGQEDEQFNQQQQQNFTEQQDIDQQQNFTEQQQEDDLAENNTNAEQEDVDEFDEIAGPQNADDFALGENGVDQQGIEQQEEIFGQQFQQNNELLDTDMQNTQEGGQAVVEVSDTDNLAAPTTMPEAGDVPSTDSAESKAGIVHWIGYVFKAKEALVNVEIVTKNNPKFDIYQEINRAKQKEIVVRYYDTKLRKKMRRDIDASEFRSPVAYIRTRKGDEEGIVEIVLTIRDEVEAKYLAQENSLLLSFPIPRRYFGDGETLAEPSEQAIDLSSPLMVVQMENSQAPRMGKVLGYVFNREVFKNVDVDSMQALPEGSLSFGNTTNEEDINAVAAEDNMMMDNSNEQENFQK